MNENDWGKAISQALLGEMAISLTDSNPEALIDQLVAAGWTETKIANKRLQALNETGGWPFPVDSQIIRRLGPAQFHSVLRQVRNLLKLTNTHPATHTGPNIIGPEERRLLAEVPPHHGNVG